MSDTHFVDEVENRGDEAPSPIALEGPLPAEVGVTTELAAPSNWEARRIELADRIRSNHLGVTERVFAIGRDLKTAKDSFKHGEFGGWVKKEFPTWGASTAARYMRAADIWGSKEKLVSCLEATGIYALTAKSTPEKLRTEIECELDAGERPSLKQIQERVKAARELKNGGAGKSAVETKVQAAADFILSLLNGKEAHLRELLRGVNPTELVKVLKQVSAELSQPK